MQTPRAVSNCLVAIALSLVFLGLAVVLGGCRPERADPPVATLPHSMKGYELYSWEIEEEWTYALVVGTNRIKTFEEVSAPNTRIVGIEGLKEELARLTSGQQVFWSAGRVPGTTLPPDRTVEAVRVFCAHRGIRLEVSVAGG